MNKIPNIKSFSEHGNSINEHVSLVSLVEGNTQMAYDMEKVIVSAAGGPQFISKKISNSQVVGKKILKDLNLTGKGAFPKNSYSTTAAWNNYFPGGAKGSTLTPKTDLFIGNKRISLKTGPARLMSGGANEATATFYTAAAKAGVTGDAWFNKLSVHMDNLLPSTNMQQLGIKGNKTELKKIGKFASVQILKQADDAHKAFTKDFKSAFSNKAFAEAFTFEAMTGDTKFGGSNGTAEYFLVTDYEGNAQIHNAFLDKGYVNKIAGQVNPSVVFKSSQNVKSQLKSPSNPLGKTGYYTFWSAVGLTMDMIVEDTVKEGLLLNEGIFDFVKRIFNKVKKWWKNFWSNVKKQIGGRLEDLLAFMTLEPKVRFRNNIRW
jgi:hypothetical protein